MASFETQLQEMRRDQEALMLLLLMSMEAKTRIAFSDPCQIAPVSSTHSSPLLEGNLPPWKRPKSERQLMWETNRPAFWRLLRSEKKLRKKLEKKGAKGENGEGILGGSHSGLEREECWDTFLQSADVSWADSCPLEDAGHSSPVLLPGNAAAAFSLAPLPDIVDFDTFMFGDAKPSDGSVHGEWTPNADDGEEQSSVEVLGGGGGEGGGRGFEVLDVADCISGLFGRFAGIVTPCNFGIPCARLSHTCRLKNSLRQHVTILRNASCAKGDL